MADVKCTFIPAKLFERDHGEVIRSERWGTGVHLARVVGSSVSLPPDGLSWEEAEAVEDEEEDEELRLAFLPSAERTRGKEKVKRRVGGGVHFCSIKNDNRAEDEDPEEKLLTIWGRMRMTMYVGVIQNFFRHFAQK